MSFANKPPRAPATAQDKLEGADLMLKAAAQAFKRIELEPETAIALLLTYAAEMAVEANIMRISVHDSLTVALNIAEAQANVDDALATANASTQGRN